MLYLHTPPFRANSFEVNEIANLFNKRSDSSMHLNYGVHILVVYYGELIPLNLQNGGSGKVDPYCLGFKK
jgi:hypothetical protein